MKGPEIVLALVAMVGVGLYLWMSSPYFLAVPPTYYYNQQGQLVQL